MTALGSGMAEAADPVRLAERIGMLCDPWQAEVLRSPAKRLCLLSSRQAGKSTVTGVLAVHTALYRPGALILVVSPSLRQSQRMFKACLGIYRSLGRPVAPTAENTLSLELENGSTIVALPADASTVRGYPAVSLLLIDEAAFVSDELFDTVTPMLAVSDGRLVVMSTPWARHGFFHKVATGTDPRWTRYKITADQCPRISSEFLAEELERKGPATYRREYFCEFVSSVGSLFDGEDLAAIVREDVAPIDWDESASGLSVVSA